MMDYLGKGPLVIEGLEMRLLHCRNGPVKGILMNGGFVK